MATRAQFSEHVGPMIDFELPDTRYALSGDVNIAYQTMGDGPVDIILVPGIASHVEFLHDRKSASSAIRVCHTRRRVEFPGHEGVGDAVSTTNAAWSCDFSPEITAWPGSSPRR